jgi:uncharacterized OsmC-like protein
MATARALPNTINGVAVDELSATVDAIKQTPAIARFQFRIRNQWVDAAQNHSSMSTFHGAGCEQPRTRPFVLEADEPPILLGKDLAANPAEYLLHALAACLTTSMVYHAAARGIRIQEVESTLEGDLDLQGFLKLDQNVRTGLQGIRVNFKIKADVPDEELEEICKLGTDHSPVFDSLTQGVPVSVSVDRLVHWSVDNPGVSF